MDDLRLLAFPGDLGAKHRQPGESGGVLGNGIADRFGPGPLPDVGFMSERADGLRWDARCSGGELYPGRTQREEHIYAHARELCW